MARTSLLTAALVSALLAGCTSPPVAPPAFAPPVWRMTESADLARPGLTVFAAVGWDGGMMFATDRPYPVVFHSADGRRWDTRLLPGGAVESLSAQPFAAYREFAYVVSADADGLAVWQTRDGRRWDERRLPDSGMHDGHHVVTVAAGPRGVLVVRAHSTHAGSGLPDYDGFESWHSADGGVFQRTGLLRLPDRAIDLTPGVVATERGFLLHDTAFANDGPPREDTPLYQSTDGTNWTHVGEGLPQGSRHAVGRAGDTLFVLGKTGDARLSVHYRRDGDDRWLPGSIDLGALPDAGVRPADQLRVSFVHPWEGGHVAVGTTASPPWEGIVWASPDGVTWSRMPVRENRFDGDVRLAAMATSGDKTVLFGMIEVSSPLSALVRLWEADGGP